jgi:PAS domain S-box-containing protein
MRRASLFWFEFLTLVAVVAVVAGLLWYLQYLGATEIARVGPVIIGPYFLILIVLALGLLAMALHGWLRPDGRARRSGEAAGAAAASDLLRLIANNPPGMVQEGEKLDAHIAAVTEAVVKATGGVGAALELVEEGTIKKAFAAGSLAPYRGLGANVGGTLIASAMDSSNVIEWKEPAGTPKESQTPGVKSMVLAPVRVGSRTLGVLRVVSPTVQGLDGQAPVLETVGRYVATVLWKAPAVAFAEKEAEKEQGEREGSKDTRARLEQLMESMDAAVWITDPTSGEILFSNSAFERIWGRPAEALTRSGRAWLDALGPEDRKRVEKTLPKEPDESAELTYSFPRPRGTEASIVHRIIPLRDQHRDLIGVGNIATDTSERHGIAGELSALRQHLLEATEMGPVIAYSARPGGDYGLTFMTPNVQAQLGYGADNFLGDATFWSAHLHPDDQTRVFEGLARLFEKGRLQQEYRFRHADGTYRILLDSARLVRSPDGEPVEIVGYWTDITDRRRIEEGMQYSLNRIKELQESRTRLLNNIAHDLGSPLTPIGLQIHLLKARADFPESSRKGLDIISRNVDHLALLIQDLKDVARLEAGQLKVDLEAADAGEIIANGVESFQESAKERGVALDAKIEKPLPTMADAQRLNQVIFNFITNALKFTPQGGKVEVRARRSGPKIMVEVQDSGRGLTQEEMDKLFKPFSQVHDRTKMKEKGTGLGLYICKGLIEKHGGQIGVDSEGHGTGSTFFFTLPIRGVEQPPAPPPAKPPAEPESPVPTPMPATSPTPEPAAEPAEPKKEPAKRKPAAKSASGRSGTAKKASSGARKK